MKNSAFRKVQKLSVTDDVESQLRQAILAGTIPPGEPLAEAQLASQMGVSRASIRQAKFQLAQEGLLDFDSRGTASVRILTDEDVREIVEFREVLDVAAVRFACQRLNESTIQRLQQLIDLVEQEPELSQVTALDLDFHEEIILAAQNSRLLASWKLLRPQLELWLSGMHRLHDRLLTMTQAETAKSHRRLLRALQARDLQLCEQLAREHAGSLRSTFLAMVSSDQNCGGKNE